VLLNILKKINEHMENNKKNLENKVEGISGSLPLKIERIIATVAKKWGHQYPGSTIGIIGLDAIEICKEYSIDWKNYM
jgi:hypothetical protein